MYTLLFPLQDDYLYKYCVANIAEHPEYVVLADYFYDKCSSDPAYKEENVVFNSANVDISSSVRKG